MTECVLSIDIGSSSLRASLFNLAGDEIPGRRAIVPVSMQTTSDGGMEFQAEPLFLNFERAISQCLRSGPAADILAVGVAAFWHSLLGVGDDGKPATPIYAWGDTRAAAAARTLISEMDDSAIQTRTGCRFHSSYWPAKLLWLKKDYPTLFWKSRQWLSLSDWIFLRLFGKSLTSVSMASATGLFHQKDLCWDHELLAFLRISESQTPGIALENFENTALFGSDMLQPFSTQWAELRNARFFFALGDGACSNLGSGCHDPSRIAINIGTTAAMRLCLPRQDIQFEKLHPAGLWSYCIDEERRLVGGALSNAGNIFAWLLDILNLPAHELEERIASMQPDSHGLTILPFFAGERSPGWTPDATATLHGLHFGVRPIQILRAFLETIALRLAWIAKNLEQSGFMRRDALFIASGGGVSAAFTQILCDALGKPVLRAQTAEASLAGAARFALERIGRLRQPNDHASQNLPPGIMFSPDDSAHAQYQAALRRHQNLYAKIFK